MAGNLRKDSIGFLESAFQGVAGAAPAGAAVATLTGAAGFALGSLPLTALIAFFVVFLNAYIIKRISTHVVSAGGYYEYVKRGIGTRTALFTGLYYIFY
ncbi:MAG: APC family permease, partial [Thermoplasmataceae archaeon]